MPPIGAHRPCLADLQLDQFKGKAPDAKPPLSGVLQARTRLEGRGDSVHRVLADANGTLTAVLPQGQINSAFAELTGIDVVNGLGLLLKKSDAREPIRCALASFEVRQGMMQARTLVVDTQDVRITGKGDIRLGPEQLDLEIKGQPKKLRIARLRTPIELRGHLLDPHVGIDLGATVKQGAVAAALGAVAPLAALVAFVDPGFAKNENCAALLGAAPAQPSQARASATFPRPQRGRGRPGCYRCAPQRPRRNPMPSGMRPRWRRYAPAAVLLLLPLASLWGAAPPVTVLVGATVIHPEREATAAASPDTTVVLRGERISAVGPGGQLKAPRGARAIDLHGKWLIPGLIDGHVHFFQSGNLYTRPDVVDLNALRPYAEEVRRNQVRLPETFKVWLASGVTSVADVGGPLWNFDMREAARASEAAPTVRIAGPLISIIDRPQLDLGDPPIIKIESPEAARALVARELARHPDFIKVWYIYQPGDDIPAHEAIVRATAESAHAAGVRLAVHATELIVAKSALRAGADYLVHSVEDEPVDAEFLELLQARHALYCPTLFVYMGYGYALSNIWQPTEAEARLADPQILRDLHLPEDPALLQRLPEAMAARVREQREPQLPQTQLRNLRTVWNAGATVVMGTDAGNIGTVHGPSVFRERALMQRAGLTPLQVLKSATVNGAQVIGDDVGVIAPGKRADLVVLDGDPLQDVENLSHASLVFKNGRAFRPAELMATVR